MDSTLDRLRAIALVLPEAVEVVVLDLPTFRVWTAPFAAYEEDGRGPLVRVKLEVTAQVDLVLEPGIDPSPGTGHHGWTDLRPEVGPDWDRIDHLVVASYRLQAPAELRGTLDALLAAAGEG